LLLEPRIPPPQDRSRTLDSADDRHATICVRGV